MILSVLLSAAYESPVPPKAAASNDVLKSLSKFAWVYTSSTLKLNSPVPLLYVRSPAALKCALTSAALGPVYVKTPLAESYAKLPSPPASSAPRTFLVLVLVRSLSRIVVGNTPPSAVLIVNIPEALSNDVLETPATDTVPIEST